MEEVDREAEAVLLRLATVVQLAAQNQRHDTRRAAAKAGPHRPTQDDLRAAARANGHELILDRKILKCRLCSNHGAWSRALTEGWLRARCNPSRPPNSFHASHEVVRCGGSSGVWVCGACGARSAGARVCGLGVLCPRIPTERGLATLRAYDLPLPAAPRRRKRRRVQFLFLEVP